MIQPNKSIIHQKVEDARAKRNPKVICQVPSGWVVMADEQYVRGHCLLLPDPVVRDLNGYDGKERTRFFNDMVLVGDALLEVTDAFKVNYEIQCNNAPALQAHIFPRYMSEPEKYRRYPAWYYYEHENKFPPKFDLERDKDLMRLIARSIMGRL